MRALVSGKRMKGIDAYTIESIGIPSMVLMERAALAVADETARRAAPGSVVWAVCGPGNNGADAVAAARMLSQEGYEAVIVLVGDEAKATREHSLQLSIAGKLDVPVMHYKEIGERSCDVLIDGIFGVGLTREIKGEYRECLEKLKGLKPAPKLTVAVDVPSGIHSDTGAIMGIALRADVTVTFGWEKMGTLLFPGRGYAGEVLVKSVGFPREAFLDTQESDGEGGTVSEAISYGPEDLRRIPERYAYSNKGSFGRVLIVAGSENMCGAAYLSALAAYRCGAGLVRVLTVKENRPVLQILLPEAVLVTYDPAETEKDREGFKKMVEAQMGWADVAVLGPGLGTASYATCLIEDVLTSAFVPVIIDADGLNVIAANPTLTTYFTENIIITPHLGEMARLTGKTIAEIQGSLPVAAATYARRYGITCVLKDAATVVAGRGGTCYINSSGNSAMAKAGSGDVLTGVIAGLIAIGMDEEEAAFMGVYVHGLAGDAAVPKGSHSLLGRELADALSAVLSRG